MSSPMPQPPGDGATRAVAPPPDPASASTGELIGQLTDQLSRLVRDEVRLAQAEVTQKAKRLGIGAGLFGGAGIVALLGLGALVTAAILGLANVLPGWLAAIIVAVALFLIAGVLALLGKKDVQQATPPLPTDTIASVQADIETLKQGISR
ncbi:MAG TPA: phage holin family protein [Blastococcus sp.]|nr:phage holin family protein [Blastococcus sp.]